ncbi:MAG: glycosyltransferase family 9 protein [Mycobacteriales bacterium]
MPTNGTPNAPLLPEVRKIAVVRANALGDYIFVIPALQALRAAYPGAEIILFGQQWHAEFLTGRPGPVDHVEVLPKLAGFGGAPEMTVSNAVRSSPEVKDFFVRMRSQRFDLALQLHGGGRHSNPVAHALGARLTAGLRDHGAPDLGRTLNYQYFQPEVFRYLEVAEMVGAPPVTFEPRLELTEKDLDEAQRVFYDGRDHGQPWIALHPGATDSRRRWPAERFTQIGDALAAADYRIIVTGTGAEAALVKQICSAMRAPAHGLVDALSVGGLAALYARCALVISNDTGPMHVAAAVGTPTVGLYWIGNLINGGPVYRRRHRPVVSWTVRCPTCGTDVTRDGYRHRPGSGCAHRPSFLADIPEAEVREHAFALLREAKLPTERVGQWR